MSDPPAKLQREALECYVAELVRQGLLIVVGKHRGKPAYRFVPGGLEWFEAVLDYKNARDDGALTEAHRKRVREAWLAIKGRVELNDAEQELLDEALRFQ